ncbi:MAG: transposase [Firmicutes bacterium]|nr:transposase [Bacillota bacterium]
MQCITKVSIGQVFSVRLHVLVVLSVLVLTLAGRMPGSQAGWIVCPPQVMAVAPAGRGADHGERSGLGATYGPFLRATWYIPVLRSWLLWVLWHLSGRQGSVWVGLVPWGWWLWQSAGVLWPWLRRQPEWQGVHWLLREGQRWLMVGYLSLFLGALLRGELRLTFPCSLAGGEGQGYWALSLGCVCWDGEESRVEVVQEEGGYRATICGHFTVRVAADHPFRVRLLLLFLRLLEVEGSRRGGRRTRDGRTPFVAQQQLATWLGMPQPDISRIEGYWLAGDWANLLSLKTVEVLTGELMARIVAVFASFPWWGVQQVHRHLREQGVAVSERQVRQAAEQSGWSQLRQELVQRYHLTAESIRPRDQWLVGQLLAQIEALLSKLEAGEGLTPEERVAVADVQVLAAEAGMVVRPALQALPWLMRVERVVFGHWEEVRDEAVRCIYCGSTRVVRKSRKPRWKKYYDAEGKLQTVAVYRYYCRNPQCDKKSFTNLPPGLVPYSRYRVETHLLAVQMYAWGYSTYRRAGMALGVSSMTVYRWVSAWGYELLSVAALFGVVKCSGVVGIDEKYVLVPKSDKPAGEMRRWMYVYFAVDVYTYDLLHIAIYPYNNKDSAHAFLLALRAKGYHPRVVVTDLRQDYGALIAQVFPQAVHHECIFHALQNVQGYIKEAYGPHYAETHPEAEVLKQQIYHIFKARSKRTAQKRYAEVMALREQYVHKTPASATVFDFLERHWPTLLNGIESDLIPRTNNTVELVIRRFDQHYQNFCGFDSIETARLFLGVFEKVYRFTPFSQDAQPRIRGQCPLELAGYDVSQVPMASLCTGLSLAWPLETPQGLVPNS